MESRQLPLAAPVALRTPGTCRECDPASGRLGARVVEDVLAGAGVLAFYQPILDVQTRRIHGWEALVRGRHPAIGDVSAVVLIEAATRHRLLDDLTLQVAEQALRTVARAADMVGEPLLLTLNIEIEQLRRDCQVVRWLLERRVPDGVRLLLEITERGEDEWTDEREWTAQSLEAAGITLGLDDYGAGAARLEFLHHRDWALVKLDRKFLLHDSPRDRTILLHFAHMLHELGIPRVAEGIETAEQFERVERLGVEYAQGYWLGRPAGEEAVLGGLACSGLRVPLQR